MHFLVLLHLFAFAVSAELYCSPPRAPYYGYIYKGQKSTYGLGSVVTFRCNRGYKLYGYSTLKCLSRGNNNAYWNYQVPTCRNILIKGN